MYRRPDPITPGPGQESVWDYPRPPRLEPVSERLRVILSGRTIADTARGHRVLETSHPPVYYFPPEDVQRHLLVQAEDQSFCEFKGGACYWTALIGDSRTVSVAWSYPKPTVDFQAIKGHFGFYASRADSCWVGDERVQAQTGDFYGGWITSRIVGPFKGGHGTLGW